MNIFIVGLGLMGGAYALRLSHQGHHVSGFDLNLENRDFNLKEKMIKSDDLADLKKADVVILALPQKACLTFTKEYLSTLKDIPLVTDIAGVKLPLVSEMNNLLPDNYISHHPMTGKESTGPFESSLVKFKDKNVIIIDHQASMKTETLLRELLRNLDFKKPTLMSAKCHDDAIAVTSHLPHVVAACMMHQPDLEAFKGAAGNSFFETTRFAAMNTDLWSDLLNSNQGALFATLESFISALQTFKKQLDSKEDLKHYLTASFERYKKLKGLWDGH